MQISKLKHKPQSLDLKGSMRACNETNSNICEGTLN